MNNKLYLFTLTFILISSISNAQITYNQSIDSSFRLASEERHLFKHGNPIELYTINNYSKAFIAWYDHEQKGTGWMGCHYSSLTDKNMPVHQHCSFETVDTTTGYLNSRFIISYGLPLNQMFIRITNINKFILGYGVQLWFQDKARIFLTNETLNIRATRLNIRTEKGPLNNTANCEKGEIYFDDNYIYYCSSKKSWKRAELKEW